MITKGKFSDFLINFNFSDYHSNLPMDSSDEEYLPDPERPKRKREPPDRTEVGASRGLKRKNDESANQQRGLILHDDVTKGKCFFIV